MQAASSGSVGNVGVVITSNQGHTPEKWAEIAMRRIISISDESIPAPLREQVHAFKDRLHAVVADYIGKAVDEQKTRDAVLADRAGREDLAAAIRRS